MTSTNRHFMRKHIIRNRSNVKTRQSAESFGEYIAHLHRAVHALGLYLDASMDGEVSQAEAIVLLHLHSNDGSTINEVHKAFLHRRSTLTSVIDRLEAKSLVRRQIGADDRRNFQLEITERGREAAHQVVECLSNLARTMGVGERELVVAVDVLAKTAHAAATSVNP